MCMIPVEVEMNLSLSNFIPFDSLEIRTNIYIRQHSFHGAFTYILIQSLQQPSNSQKRKTTFH